MTTTEKGMVTKIATVTLMTAVVKVVTAVAPVKVAVRVPPHRTHTPLATSRL
jgi:hypothetical protein